MIESKPYAETVLNETNGYVNTVAWHCYNHTGYENMSAIHSEYSNVDQYMTECNMQTGNWTAVVDFILGPLLNWSKGSIAWPLVSDPGAQDYLPDEHACSFCSGMVTINNEKNYELEILYYVMAQFSRFMPVGATVLETDGSAFYSSSDYFHDIAGVASLNPDDHKRVVVIASNRTEDTSVTVAFQSGDSWTGSVQSGSVTTWVLPST